MTLIVGWALAAALAAGLLRLGRSAALALIAAAAVLGAGAALARGSHAHLGGLGAVLAGAELAAAVVMVAAWAVVKGRTRRQHGSAAIASTRYVRYTGPETGRKRARKGLRNDRR